VLSIEHFLFTFPWELVIPPCFSKHTDFRRQDELKRALQVNISTKYCHAEAQPVPRLMRESINFSILNF